MCKNISHTLQRHCCISSDILTQISASALVRKSTKIILIRPFKIAAASSLWSCCGRVPDSHRLESDQQCLHSKEQRFGGPVQNEPSKPLQMAQDDHQWSVFGLGDPWLRRLTVQTAQTGVAL